MFILSDQAIATRIEAFPQPDLEKVCQDITPDLTPVADYKPYDLSAPERCRAAGGAGHAYSERALPDRRRARARRVRASHRARRSMHMQMTAKRRKKAAGAWPRRCQCRKSMGRLKGNVLLVGWGSTRGPIQEAVDRARAAGDSVSSLHLKYLNPLPPGLGRNLRRVQPRPRRGNER